MKDKVKNIICGGAVLALLGWTVYTIFQQQTPGQLAAALLSADWRVLLLGLPLMALFICCEATPFCAPWAVPSPSAGAPTTPAWDFSSAPSPPPPPAVSPPRWCP